MKLKVLWFCNYAFSDIKPVSTGTWLNSMGQALVNSGEIQLYNISQGKVGCATRKDFQSICQWLVPFESLRSNGLPSLKTINEIQGIVEKIKPDIIHIWGTENYWGLLTAREYIKGNIVLEIQGLKYVISKYFYSGLSFMDLLNCFGLKEILKPSVSLVGQKHSFKKWGIFEKEMLLKHNFISTQSDWVRAYVKNENPFAQIFNTSILLRAEFIEAERWNISKCLPYQIFTSTSSDTSYKGLHILLNAVAILKNRYPQIKLLIAGSVRSGLRESGYSKWLKRRVKRLQINENVFWIGPLDARNLVLQMNKASVVVIPSFVESYCVALEEALTIGVPTVVSFAGAMPELAIDEKATLFFQPGDATKCADNIERFFVNNAFAEFVSRNSYNEKTLKKNIAVANIQISIYKDVVSKKRTSEQNDIL